MLEQMAQSGMEVKALLNRPKLAAHLQFYWSMFKDIADTERSYAGMEGEPIPLSLQTVEGYCRINQFSREDFETAWRNVRLIDYYWLSAVKEKREKSRATKSATKTPAVPPQRQIKGRK